MEGIYGTPPWHPLGSIPAKPRSPFLRALSSLEDLDQEKDDDLLYLFYTGEKLKVSVYRAYVIGKLTRLGSI
jgi:hypothetical protein